MSLHSTEIISLFSTISIPVAVKLAARQLHAAVSFPSWQPSVYSVNQGTPRRPCNLNIHYSVHKNPTLRMIRKFPLLYPPSLPKTAGSSFPLICTVTGMPRVFPNNPHTISHAEFR
jgi:hypothetical protein